MAQNAFIDSSTESGSRALCGMIGNYWRSQGFPQIQARPVLVREETGLNGREAWVTYWRIFSNIGAAGLPNGAGLRGIEFADGR